MAAACMASRCAEVKAAGTVITARATSVSRLASAPTLTCLHLPRLQGKLEHSRHATCQQVTDEIEGGAVTLATLQQSPQPSASARHR